MRDTDSGAQVARFHADEQVTSFCIHPDGREVAVGDAAG